jgi:hypothetical protein
MPGNKGSLQSILRMRRQIRLHALHALDGVIKNATAVTMAKSPAS